MLHNMGSVTIHRIIDNFSDRLEGPNFSTSVAMLKETPVGCKLGVSNRKEGKCNIGVPILVSIHQRSS